MTDMEKKKRLISVVIPARNEEDNVGPLFVRLRQAMDTHAPYEFEIIFINDDSRDATAMRLQELAEQEKNVKVLTTGYEKGLTNALKLGFSAARGDWIVFIPADLQADPVADFPKLLGELDRGADLVLGVRGKRSGYKKIVSRIYHRLVNVCFGVSYRDMNWIKAFRRSLLEKIQFRYEWHRYLPVFAYHAGMKITEVEVEAHPRPSGRSKFGLLSIGKGLQDLVTLQFDLLFFHRPMRLFGTIGMILLLVAVIQTIAMLGYLVSTGLDQRLGTGFYVVLLLLVIVGMQFVGFGLLAEYLAHLYDRLERTAKDNNDQAL